MGSDDEDLEFLRLTALKSRKLASEKLSKNIKNAGSKSSGKKISPQKIVDEPDTVECLSDSPKPARRENSLDRFMDELETEIAELESNSMNINFDNENTLGPTSSRQGTSLNAANAIVEEKACDSSTALTDSQSKKGNKKKSKRPKQDLSGVVWPKPVVIKSEPIEVIDDDESLLLSEDVLNGSGTLDNDAQNENSSSFLRIKTPFSINAMLSSNAVATETPNLVSNILPNEPVLTELTEADSLTDKNSENNEVRHFSSVNKPSEPVGSSGIDTVNHLSNRDEPGLSSKKRLTPPRQYSISPRRRELSPRRSPYRSPKSYRHSPKGRYSPNKPLSKSPLRRRSISPYNKSIPRGESPFRRRSNSPLRSRDRFSPSKRLTPVRTTYREFSKARSVSPRKSVRRSLSPLSKKRSSLSPVRRLSPRLRSLSRRRSLSPRKTNTFRSRTPIPGVVTPPQGRSPVFRKRSPFVRSRSRVSQSSKSEHSRSPVPRRRPLSPLIINPTMTDALNTYTMAPLSPRSAAFVLQNCEIIARRKLSPRRSYSRSRSRSRTPLSYSSRSRSITPGGTPIRYRSRSPAYRPYYSPRRSISPAKRRRLSPAYQPLNNRFNSPNRPRYKSPAKLKNNLNRDELDKNIDNINKRPISPKPSSSLRPYPTNRRANSPSRRSPIRGNYRRRNYYRKSPVPQQPQDKTVESSTENQSIATNELNKKPTNEADTSARPQNENRIFDDSRSRNRLRQRPNTNRFGRRRSTSQSKRSNRNSDNRRPYSRDDKRNRTDPKGSTAPKEDQRDVDKIINEDENSSTNKQTTKENEKINTNVDNQVDSSNLPLDPILEARKRKFERNVPISAPIGVIKLKVSGAADTFSNVSDTNNGSAWKRPISLRKRITFNKNSNESKEVEESNTTVQVQLNDTVVSDQGKINEKVIDDNILNVTHTEVQTAVPSVVNTGSVQPQKDAEISDIERQIDELLESDSEFLKGTKDIWSSDESDTEKEGRFKSSSNNDQVGKIRVIPFTQLLDGGIKKDLEKVKLPNDDTDKFNRRNSHRHRYDRRPTPDSKRKSEKAPSRNRPKILSNSNSSQIDQIESSSSKKKQLKSALKLKKRAERIESAVSQKRAIEETKFDAPVASKIFRKAPSPSPAPKLKKPKKRITLFDDPVGVKSSVSSTISSTSNSVFRKVVEITNDEPEVDEVDLTESGAVSPVIHGNSSDKADDLRAELSRRRAQRRVELNLPAAEKVTAPRAAARLLQNAFQEMVKKPVSVSSVKSSKAIRSEDTSEKLPIHLRLGRGKKLNPDAIFTSNTVTKPTVTSVFSDPLGRDQNLIDYDDLMVDSLADATVEKDVEDELFTNTAIKSKKRKMH